MSSMLVAAIVAARRRSYDGRDHEFHSNSSTKVDPIIFCKQCDERQVDAAKKRLDQKLHPQQTNRSSTKGLGCLKLLAEEKKRENSKAWKKS